MYGVPEGKLLVRRSVGSAATMELRLFGLALCMLLTGSINTIATKYQVPQLTLTHILTRQAPPFSLTYPVSLLTSQAASLSAEFSDTRAKAHALCRMRQWWPTRKLV